MKRANLTKEQRELRVGDVVIPFEISYSKRKSLGIRVYPDGRVEVRAPVTSKWVTIQEMLTKRAGWILTQQKRFVSRPAQQPKQYIAGERFHYLGEDVELIIERSVANRVQVADGKLQVESVYLKSEAIQQLITNWYKAEAKRIFKERFLLACEKVEKIGIFHSGNFTLRMMKSRWGSCTSDGKITLNSELVKAPLGCIDYVILHELCHLKELNHSKAYYRLLSSVMPEWKFWKQQLPNHSC